VPTYEYRCDQCGKNFDVVQSFHDDPLTNCPTCGAPVKKVFGNVGIVFKGSGFYKTDSRNGSSSKGSDSKDTSSGDSGAKGSESKNGTSSDAKKATAESGSSDAKSGSSSKDSTPKSTASD
jgi:putative FmdB family regulatory protein